MDRSLRRVLAVLALATVAAGARGQPAGERLDGTDSAYARSLDRIPKAWPSRPFFSDALRGVELTCIATAGVESYVGILRRTAIHAPMEAVEGVLDDLEQYKNPFPGTIDVRVASGSSSANRFVTIREQRVPIPFMPNVVYELSHVVDRSSPGRIVYRYRLRQADRLKASDGMVVLESVGPRRTQFTEYGFFHPSAGPVPASVVWGESVRGAFLGNMAIKLKAENPQWSYARIASEAERQLASDAAHVEQCLADRHAAAQRLGVLQGSVNLP